MLFPNFEPVHCSMSSSNCCFLTHIRVSQEEGKVVSYSHLFKKFSTVCCDPHSQRLYHSQLNRSRCFFWNSFPFSIIQRMLTIWSLVPLPFLNISYTFGSSRFTYCWSLVWRILSITLLAGENTSILLWGIPNSQHNVWYFLLNSTQFSISY